MPEKSADLPAFTGEVIRVLVADDRPETQESLRKMLMLEHSIAIVGEAATGEEAIEKTGKLRPDIVLMDLNMPGMDGMVATEVITKKHPFAHVVMMSVHADGESVRRCMLAGARDFLVKPFTSEELASSIRCVYDLESSRRASYESIAAPPKEAVIAPVPRRDLGKIITVFGPKGGTGSSTIAVNLAVALQRPGRRSVALVDANLQFGDIAALLNLRPQRSVADLVPQIRELDAHLMGAVMASHTSGIRVLLAPNLVESSDLVTPEHMAAILEQLQHMFDYIVVDTKGFLYDLVLTILDKSDRVLLVATPDIPALKSVRQFLAFTETLDYPPERYALIINEADRPGAIETADIEDSLKREVTKRLPEDRLTVMQAAGEGVPFVSSSPKSPLTQSMVELAMLLMNELEAQPEGKESSDAKSSKRVWRLSRKTRKRKG